MLIQGQRPINLAPNGHGVEDMTMSTHSDLVYGMILWMSSTQVEQELWLSIFARFVLHEDWSVVARMLRIAQQSAENTFRQP